MHKDYKEFLRHIQDECLYITQVSQGLTIDAFLENETLKRAVVRSLEVMGEASKKVPADVKIMWSDIPWKNMAGMRDRLIHDYMGVNYRIVWDVMLNKVPEMLIEIHKVLES